MTYHVIGWPSSLPRQQRSMDTLTRTVFAKREDAERYAERMELLVIKEVPDEQREGDAE